MGGEREGERLELELGVQTFPTILRLAELFFLQSRESSSRIVGVRAGSCR